MKPLQLWLIDCPVSCLAHGHTVHPSNSQMPGCNCDSPLEKHNYVQTGHVNRTSAQMQNCHNECIKCWAGEAFVMTHQLSLSEWTQREIVSRKLYRNESSSISSLLLFRILSPPCSHMLGQHGSSCIHKLSWRDQLVYPAEAHKEPSAVGLVEMLTVPPGSSRWGKEFSSCYSKPMTFFFLPME